MGTDGQRRKRRRNGLGNWRLIRYADLSGRPDKSAYADSRIMPMMLPDAGCAGEIVLAWSP